MVDLHCHSCYIFLDGASPPSRAGRPGGELGYTALALTDHNGLYGSIEFAVAANAMELQPITGAEVTLEDESHLTLLAEKPPGYANLCRLLSMPTARTSGSIPASPTEPGAARTELIALSGCPKGQVPRLLQAGQGPGSGARCPPLQRVVWADGFFLEVQQNLVRGDTERGRALAELGRRTGLGLVATNNTHYHVRDRHRLQDTLVAIKHGVSLDDAHIHRRANSEFALKRPTTYRERFREHPQALVNTQPDRGAVQAFDITHDLGYVFPDFVNEARDDRVPQRGRGAGDALLGSAGGEVRPPPPIRSAKRRSSGWRRSAAGPTAQAGRLLPGLPRPAAALQAGRGGSCAGSARPAAASRCRRAAAAAPRSAPSSATSSASRRSTP